MPLSKAARQAAIKLAGEEYLHWQRLYENLPAAGPYRKLLYQEVTKRLTAARQRLHYFHVQGF